MATLRREALASDYDPFDDAMVAAVVGLAKAMKAEIDALADTEARLGRLARKGADEAPWSRLRVIGRWN